MTQGRWVEVPVVVPEHRLGEFYQTLGQWIKTGVPRELHIHIDTPKKPAELNPQARMTGPPLRQRTLRECCQTETGKWHDRNCPKRKTNRKKRG